MRVKLLMVLGLMILLVDCNGVFAQRGGGKGGRGGPGGGGPGGGGQAFDPSQWFDKITGGKEVWVRADIIDQRQLQRFDMMAQQLGVSNGQITREQFTTATQQFRGGGRGPGGGQGPGRGPGGPGQAESVDQMAEVQFKQMDRNGDGFLNSDEVTGSLRTDFTRYANRDGLIDLAAFKTYLQDQMRQARNGPAQFDFANIAPEPEEEKRPVVYTAGNYPKELPPWFKQLDMDKDGQIGLYEWRRAGKSIEEFEAMDRNNDGFLTVEEVLYAQALAKKTGTAADIQVANFSPGNLGGPQHFAGGPPQMNGQQRGGGGRPQFTGGPPQGSDGQPQMQRFGPGRQGGGQPGDNGNGGFRKKGGNRGGGQGGG